MSQEELSLMKGDAFNKNELKSRLHAMDIEFDTSNQRKSYYEKLYNEAIKNSMNRKKIQDRLTKDAESSNENKKKRTRDQSNEARQDLSIADKKSKVDTDINVKRVDRIHYEEEKNATSPPSLVSTKTNTDLIIMKNEISEKRTQHNFVPNPQILTDIKIKEIQKEAKIEENVIPSNINEIPANQNKPELNNFQPKVTTTKININQITFNSNTTSSSLVNPFLNKPQMAQFTQNTAGDKPLSENINLPAKNETTFHKKNLIQDQAIDSSTGSTRLSPTIKQPIIENINTVINRTTNINDFKVGQINSKNEQIKKIIISSDTQNRNEKIVSPDFQIEMKKVMNQEFQELKDRFRKGNNELSVINEISSSSDSFLPVTVSDNKIMENTVNPLSKHICHLDSGINGGEQEIMQGSEKKENIQILSEKNDSQRVLPIIQRFNENEKWQLDNQPNPLRLLIKYFVAGMVCSVLFYGLYYCIQNCPSISFDRMGLRGRPDSPQISLDQSHKYSVRDTTTKNSVNNDSFFPNFFKTNKVTESISNPVPVSPSFIETMKQYLGSIAWAFINPKEFILNLAFQGFKYFVIDLAWTYFKNHMWYFLGILVIKMIAYKAYQTYLNSRNAESIFKNIKDRLRVIYDSGKHLEGITEEDIVKTYSKDYGISEDSFRKNNMPRLKKMRQVDGEIKEFDFYDLGRSRLCWQYSGYGY